MLLEVARLLVGEQLVEREHALGLARAEQRRLPAPGTGNPSVRATPPILAGSAVASAMITNGASRPLAPCTVITRTAWAGADGSRWTSTSPRPNQARKRSNDGVSLRSNSIALDSNSSIGSRDARPRRR